MNRYYQLLGGSDWKNAFGKIVYLYIKKKIEKN